MSTNSNEPKDIELAKGSLPSIPTPPAGAVKHAFFVAIRYRSIAGAIKAYNSAVNELADTEAAFTRLKSHMMEHHRVARLLEDAEKIHRVDAVNRDIQLINAEEKRKEALHQAALRDRERQKEMGKKGAKLTEDEQEFIDHLDSRLQPARYRQLAEKLIEDYVASRPTLTKEDEAYIKSVREAAEEAIMDMT